MKKILFLLTLCLGIGVFLGGCSNDDYEAKVIDQTIVGKWKLLGINYTSSNSKDQEFDEEIQEFLPNGIIKFSYPKNRFNTLSARYSIEEEGVINITTREGTSVYSYNMSDGMLMLSVFKDSWEPKYTKNARTSMMLERIE